MNRILLSGLSGFLVFLVPAGPGVVAQSSMPSPSGAPELQQTSTSVSDPVQAPALPTTGTVSQTPGTTQPLTPSQQKEAEARKKADAKKEADAKKKAEKQALAEANAQRKADADAKKKADAAAQEAQKKEDADAQEAQKKADAQKKLESEAQKSQADHQLPISNNSSKFSVFSLQSPLSAQSSTASSPTANTELKFDNGFIHNNSASTAYLVHGKLLAPGVKLPIAPHATNDFAYALADGTGCIAGKSLAEQVISSDPPSLTLQPGKIFPPRRNNIAVSEPKAVDPTFLKQKYNQAAQALAGLTPWSASALTSQYGALQGSTNSNSYLAAQLTTAGQPQTQTTYATGQPSTTTTNYAANCPTGYVVTGITTGNGITCALPTTGPASDQGTLTVNQTTIPTPSVQSQVSVPAFSASIPTVPTATGALSPPSSLGLSPTDVLTQQVELNSELLTYQALYNGIASDNSQISSNGSVGSVRPQVTLAFPITVQPYAPYPGAVAEVRIFMVPGREKELEAKEIPGPHLSVVNLLPASNTYNVARATTNTKQFGAGVTLDVIGIGVTGGKTKSALYLAKDTDTIALQYPNPAQMQDGDSKTPLMSMFRELKHMGQCEATSTDVWATAAQAIEKEPYDRHRALIFGWQFKPVLGNQNVLPINRLLYAQVALNDIQSEIAPIIFVETRWRQYDRKTGVVGAVYQNSCSWQYLGTANPLHYETEVAYVTTDDLGGGNVRVVANGRFTDPNFQVRMGNTQKAPDAVNTTQTQFEYYTTAAALVSTPTLQVLSEGNDPVPIVTAPAKPATCQMGPVTAHATPYADGTAVVTVDMPFGSDRTSTDEFPLVLSAGTVYGLQGHPFISNNATTAQERSVQFSEKLDALTGNPAVVVKDVSWSQSPVSATISIGPAFSAVQLLRAKTSPPTGAGTPPPGKDNTDSTVVTQGLYQIAGTGFRSFCKTASTCDLSPLTYIDTTSGAATTFDNTQLRIIDDRTARLTVDDKIAKAVPNWPLVLEWTDPSGAKSDWSLSTKATPPTSITADIQPNRNDGVKVVFSGQDFSGVSNVGFEGTNLTILAKDSKSITVLVTTAVTKTAGTKDLIATGADGKPIVLPLTVVGR